MHFGMYANTRIIQAIKCPVCGQKEGHAPGCLQAQLDHLLTLQRHMPCPKCGERQVAVNSDDFFECRKCNTQFSTSAAEKDAPWHFLDDPRSFDLLVAAELSQKGHGNFPLDKKIEEITEQIRSQIKRPRKRKKELRMRHFQVTAETLFTETIKSKKGVLEHSSGPTLSEPLPTVAVYADRISLVNWGKFSLAAGEVDYGILKEFVTKRLKIEDGTISFTDFHSDRRLRITGLIEKPGD